MHKYVAALAAFVSSAVPSAAWANACDAEIAAMPVSRAQVEANDYLRTDFAVRIAAMSAADARQALTGDMTLPVAGLPLQPGFTDSDFKTFQDWVASRLKLSFATQHRAAIRLNSRDSEIADALRQCLNRTGGLSVVLTPVNSSTVTLTIQWWPTAEHGQRSAKVGDIDVEGGYVAGGKVWKARRDVDLGLAAARTMTISHRPEQTVHVRVRTDLGDGEAYLAPPLPH